MRGTPSASAFGGQSPSFGSRRLIQKSCAPKRILFLFGISYSLNHFLSNQKAFLRLRQNGMDFLPLGFFYNKIREFVIIDPVIEDFLDIQQSLERIGRQFEVVPQVYFGRGNYLFLGRLRDRRK